MKVRLVYLITYYALPSLRQLSVIPVVDIINDSRAICSARRSIGDRFVAPRRLALTYHFSRFNSFFLSSLPLSASLISLRSIPNSMWACRLYCIRVSLRTFGTNDTHANARETVIERYVVQAHIKLRRRKSALIA